MAAEDDKRVTLSDGLVFEVGCESRIEDALTRRREDNPDHVWEPQTTKLLKLLARNATNVIIGGAYIGDQALPVAKEMLTMGNPGTVHAFEPAPGPYARLVHHRRLNGLPNVNTYRLALWNKSNVTLAITGGWALANASEDSAPHTVSAESITLDDFVAGRGLERVEVIHLDLEGGEEKALRGADTLLSLDPGDAPHVVFEVHRQNVDWSSGLERTSIMTFLLQREYRAWAVRDFQGNEPMHGRPVELVPIRGVYLEGPPHGFNVLATKELDLPHRLGLVIVEHVSPKLLWNRDPRLHHPRH